MQSALSLIGEIEIAVACNREIVDTFESLRQMMRHQRRNLACIDIQRKQSVSIIRNDQAAIRMKLEAIRPAIVLDDQIPFAGTRNAKNAAEWNIHQPQIAERIKAWPFEKRVNIAAMQIGLDPGIMRTRFV